MAGKEYKLYVVGCIDPRAKRAHHKLIKDYNAKDHCYLHLEAGGAGIKGFFYIRRILSEINIANPSTIVLTVHEDCQKCKKCVKKLRNLRKNLAAVRRKHPTKTVIGMQVMHDGSYHRI